MTGIVLVEVRPFLTTRVNRSLRFILCNLGKVHHIRGLHMFEVSRYEHPEIFVTSRQTGETYKFFVRDDGTLAHDEASFDQGNARRAAIAYLFQKRLVEGKLAVH